MSINLSNVKQNTVRDIDGVILSKGSDGYGISAKRHGSYLALLWYSKDEKAWYITWASLAGDQTVKLEGATAKTAFDLAMAAWDATLVETEEPEAEEAVEDAAPEPSKELVHVPAAQPATAAEAVEATQFTWVVETKGGHGPHRTGAYRKIFEATGAEVAVVDSKGKRYREDLTIVQAVGAPEAITRLTRIMEAAVPQMERMADVICRAVSKQARAEGRHHSHPGALARRGYLRGFGAGVADVLAGRNTTGEWTTPVTEDIDAQLFDANRWLDGHAAGVVFAEGMLAEERAISQLQDA